MNIRCKIIISPKSTLQGFIRQIRHGTIFSEVEQNFQKNYSRDQNFHWKFCFPRTNFLEQNSSDRPTSIRCMGPLFGTTKATTIRITDLLFWSRFICYVMLLFILRNFITCVNVRLLQLDFLFPVHRQHGFFVKPENSIILWIYVI